MAEYKLSKNFINKYSRLQKYKAYIVDDTADKQYGINLNYWNFYFKDENNDVYNMDGEHLLFEYDEMWGLPNIPSTNKLLNKIDSETLSEYILNHMNLFDYPKKVKPNSLFFVIAYKPDYELKSNQMSRYDYLICKYEDDEFKTYCEELSYKWDNLDRKVLAWSKIG